MNNGKTPGKYRLTHAERWASAEQAYLGICRKRETLVRGSCCWKSELMGKRSEGMGSGWSEDDWRSVGRHEVECCPSGPLAPNNGVCIRRDLAPSFLEPDNTAGGQNRIFTHKPPQAKLCVCSCFVSCVFRMRRSLSHDSQLLSKWLSVKTKECWNTGTKGRDSRLENKQKKYPASNCELSL